jgi:hypothetical protein
MNRASVCPDIQLKKLTEFSLGNSVFQRKDRTMDNVQNCDSYINIQ